MKPVTLLLAEDHVVVREGLRSLLVQQADFRVVGEAADGRQAVAMARELRPEIVLMDIAMPLLNGLDATRQVRKALPATLVLVLSGYGDDASVRAAFDAGAAGFLLKQCSSRELGQAIRLVREGGTFVSPAFSGERPGPRRGGTAPGTRPALTPREREVLQLIAEGHANKQVAGHLGLSIKTVGTHREHIMAKLDIHDTAGLTRYAMETGMIESGLRGRPI